MPESLERARREFVELRDGRRLSYLEWGDPAAPVLLLLHGGTACGADWWQVAAAFEDDWRVVAPDQRGCGHSDWDPDARYGIAPQLDDLDEAIAAIRLEQVAAIGHSLGAGAALLLAARRPDLVRALVLEDGGPRDGSPRPPALAREIPPAFATRDDALAFLADSGLGGRGRAPWVLETRFVEDPDGTLRWLADMAGARRWAADGGEPLLAALWGEVERLRCPTLYVRGAESTVVPPDVPRRLAELSPLVRPVEIADAGHGVHYERPDAFVAVVREFLAGL
jgi:pimeloyl-ACP methyl ester carboxylesterase